MDADEIVSLTAESISDLIESYLSAEEAEAETGNRHAPRWPFPGALQAWVTDEHGVETIAFGTCYNISAGGLAGRTDDLLPVGEILPIAIHLPQASYHGQATVRHCTPKTNGYFVGLEFYFA